MWLSKWVSEPVWKRLKNYRINSKLSIFCGRRRRLYRTRMRYRYCVLYTAVPRRRAERDKVNHVVFHLQYRHVIAFHHRQAWNRRQTRVGRWASTEDDVRLTDTHSCFKYTLWAVKTCRFVFDYNSAFSRSIFYTFCTCGNRKEHSTKKLQNLLLHTSCVSTLPSKTKTIYKQQILKSIVTVGCSQLKQKVIQCSSFPILGRKFFH